MSGLRGPVVAGCLGIDLAVRALPSRADRERYHAEFVAELTKDGDRYMSCTVCQRDHTDRLGPGAHFGGVAGSNFGGAGQLPCAANGSQPPSSTPNGVALATPCVFSATSRAISFLHSSRGTR